MFFLRHPQPVRPRKAVPELQVSSQSKAADTKIIVVEHSVKDLQTLQKQVLEKMSVGKKTAAILEGTRKPQKRA